LDERKNQSQQARVEGDWNVRSNLAYHRREGKGVDKEEETSEDQVLDRHGGGGEGYRATHKPRAKFPEGVRFQKKCESLGQLAKKRSKDHS
jgi:hypothetical protein